MMYSEFLNHTGLSEKVISHSQYQQFIEPVYMESEHSQRVFSKNFYDMYTIYVSKAIEKVIHQATLEAKLNLIDDIDTVLRDRCDKVREQNTELFLSIFGALTKLTE